jgi:hypothetical protein
LSQTNSLPEHPDFRLRGNYFIGFFSGGHMLDIMSVEQPAQAVAVTVNVAIQRLTRVVQNSPLIR